MVRNEEGGGLRTIELGFADPTADTGWERPVPRRWRWWRARRRPVLSAAAAVLVLGGLTAGVPQPAPVTPTMVRDVPRERFIVVGDMLFLPEPERGRSWAVHALPGGEYRWSLPVDLPGYPPGWLAPDGTLLGWRGGPARDSATGEVRWSRIGLSALPWSAVGVVESEFVQDRRDEVLAEFGSPLQLARRLEGVDLATGEVRWSARFPTGVRAWVVGTPAAPQVVAVTPDGVVEVRDLASGRVQARRAVLESGQAFRAEAVAVVDGVLVLRDWRARWIMYGYALPSLDRLWAAELRAGLRAEPCGRLVCLHPPTGGPPRYTEAVDPDTGAMVWRTLDGEVRPMGDRLLLLDREGMLRGALDPGTGRVLRDLTGWLPVYSAPPDPGGLTLVARGGGGRTRLARLDLATLALTALGSVPRELTGCQGFPGGLVCHDEHHRVGVWPLPGGAAG
jgi:hypothetical protein